jgi:hypothetical protein
MGEGNKASKNTGTRLQLRNRSLSSLKNCGREEILQVDFNDPGI